MVFAEYPGTQLIMVGFASKGYSDQYPNTKVQKCEAERLRRSLEPARRLFYIVFPLHYGMYDV